MEKVVILGSGAQGKITADLCRDMGINLSGYLDDTKEIGTVVNNLRVLGKFSLAWEGGLGKGVSYTVALGDPFMRTLFFGNILRSGGKAATIIHPKSFISPSASIGEGTLLNPFCCSLRAPA